MPKVTEAFVNAATQWRDVVVAKDHDRFRRMFEEVRAHFGDFTGEALEQSSYLIDRLVERA